MTEIERHLWWIRRHLYWMRKRIERSPAQRDLEYDHILLSRAVQELKLTQKLLGQ